MDSIEQFWYWQTSSWLNCQVAVTVLLRWYTSLKHNIMNVFIPRLWQACAVSLIKSSLNLSHNKLNWCNWFCVHVCVQRFMYKVSLINNTKSKPRQQARPHPDTPLVRFFFNRIDKIVRLRSIAIALLLCIALNPKRQISHCYFSMYVMTCLQQQFDTCLVLKPLWRPRDESLCWFAMLPACAIRIFNTDWRLLRLALLNSLLGQLKFGTFDERLCRNTVTSKLLFSDGGAGWGGDGMADVGGYGKAAPPTRGGLSNYRARPYWVRMTMLLLLTVGVCSLLSLRGFQHNCVVVEIHHQIGYVRRWRALVHLSLMSTLSWLLASLLVIRVMMCWCVVTVPRDWDEALCEKRLWQCWILYVLYIFIRVFFMTRGVAMDLLIVLQILAAHYMHSAISARLVVCVLDFKFVMAVVFSWMEPSRKM